MKKISTAICILFLCLLFFSCTNTKNSIDTESNNTNIQENTQNNTEIENETYSNGLKIKIEQKPLLHYVGGELVSEGLLTWCEVTGIGTCADTDIVIPSTYNGYPVTTITSYFASDNIKSITLPDSISKVNLQGCPNLTNIIVSPENKTFKDIDGNLYTKNGQTLIRYAAGKTDSSFEIPSDVVEIEEDAFRDSKNLKSVNIPASVETIGDYAFENCSSLTNINISTTYIGKYCFSNCTSLKTAAFNGDSIPEGALKDCSNLTSVVLGENVLFIHKSAFENCSSLYDIDTGLPLGCLLW